MITARFEGQDRVYAAFAAMMAKAEAETVKTIESVLEKVARQERTMLSLGWHPKGTRTGSIPPAPPWRISGDLSRSVRVEKPHSTGPFRWEGRMGPTAIYARIQELGGVTGRGHRTVLPARPHLKPAWEIVRPSVHGQFVKAWHIRP